MAETIINCVTEHVIQLLIAGFSFLLVVFWALVRGMKALLRDRIYQAYYLWIDRGYCPMYARESIEFMYREYKLFRGNGNVAKIVSKLLDLPVTKKEMSV